MITMLDLLRDQIQRQPAQFEINFTSLELLEQPWRTGDHISHFIFSRHCRNMLTKLVEWYRSVPGAAFSWKTIHDAGVVYHSLTNSPITNRLPSTLPTAREGAELGGRIIFTIGRG